MRAAYSRSSAIRSRTEKNISENQATVLNLLLIKQMLGSREIERMVSTSITQDRCEESALKFKWTETHVIWEVQQRGFNAVLSRASLGRGHDMFDKDFNVS